MTHAQVWIHLHIQWWDVTSYTLRNIAMLTQNNIKQWNILKHRVSCTCVTYSIDECPFVLSQFLATTYRDVHKDTNNLVQDTIVNEWLFS